MRTEYSESGKPDPTLSTSVRPKIIVPPRPLASLPAGSDIRLSADQLEYLFRRLAKAIREPRSLSAYATPAAPNKLLIGIGTNAAILTANKYRWAVAFSAQTALVNIAFGTQGVAFIGGLGINSGTAATVITYNDIGAAITREVFANGTSAGATLNWQEFITPFPLDGSMPFTL